MKPVAHTLWMDLIGGSLLATVIAGFVYLAFLREDSVQQELDELTSRVSTSREELAALRAVLDSEQESIADKRVELEDSGQLPDRIPVEQDLQTLSVLARRHHLEVLRVDPIQPREYPGLKETRYSFEVTGTMPDMARFFKAIEQAEFWADVSYFKIEQRRPGPGEDPADQVAGALTISLFSSA